MPYRRNIKRLWMVAAGITVLAAVPAWAAPGLVRTIRCSSSGPEARIVLDLSRPLAYDVRLSPDAGALIVTIEDAVSESSIADVTIGGGGLRLATTRTIRGGDGSSRVEVTMPLEAPVGWKHFTLASGRSKPDRIVIDVQRGGIPPEAAVAAARDPEPAAAADEPVAVPESRPDRRNRPFVVAVDAGHGGHDTGTLGKHGLVEKKIALDIAERVAADLNARSGVRAVMTRDRDVYLTLPQRNEIAERLGADIFVSIHLNSAPSSSARGAEIYFVAPAGAERAAHKELSSGDAAAGYGLDGRDDADIVHMLLDVNQQSVLARSETLAASILDEVRSSGLLPTRAVKQKSFSVLRTISMPSVLVEAGFLSNNSDAKLLRETGGRHRVAASISAGIFEFLRTNPPARGSDSSPQTIVHRVQSGDTLWTISKRYNTTITRLCQLNGLRKSQPLHVGQELVVAR